MKAIYFALIVMFLVACKKDETPQGEDNLFFVEFEIDGIDTRYEDGVNNYGNGPGLRTYEDSIGRLYNQFTQFITDPLLPGFGRNVLKIQMVKFFTDTVLPTEEVGFSIFNEGAYDYGFYTLDSSTGGVNGAIIEYVDNDSVVWTGDIKAGQQESWADFTITSHEAVESSLFAGKTKGTFNCRVFDGTGGQLDLRNGSIHARTIYKPQ